MKIMCLSSFIFKLQKLLSTYSQGETVGFDYIASVKQLTNSLRKLNFRISKLKPILKTVLHKKFSNIFVEAQHLKYDYIVTLHSRLYYIL